MKNTALISILATDCEHFIEAVLAHHRVREDIAKHVAKGLVQASIRGIDSHGIQLLPHYVAALKAGRINRDPQTTLKKTTDATAVLDADHMVGHAAGAIAMEHAIELAGRAGVGVVLVRNSTHFGAAAYFGLMAAEADMVGLAFTHATPHVLYPGARKATVGPNAICFTAPMDGEGPYCLDMATTSLSFNRLILMRQTGAILEPGWGADDEGHPRTDPAQVTQLFPIGGYKGFGLAVMVDILCGILTGMPTGPDVSAMYGNDLSTKRRLGHCFAAINIAAFLDIGVFKRQMQDYCRRLRQQPMVDATTEAMVAGDPEKRTMQRRQREGIPIPDSVRERLASVAKEAQVELPGALIPDIAL